MRRLALKGAIASRTSGLGSDTLGPLTNHQDAKRWLEDIGRAVVTGRLKAEGERVTMQVVEESKAEVEDGPLNESRLEGRGLIGTFPSLPPFRGQCRLSPR